MNVSVVYISSSTRLGGTTFVRLPEMSVRREVELLGLRVAEYFLHNRNNSTNGETLYIEVGDVVP